MIDHDTYIVVALPTSILSVEHHLFLKSMRIHQVARWSSIFGVKEVVFYREPSTTLEEYEEHKLLILDHWEYFFTPPYLRRRLVSLKPTLRYVGMLPPIRLKAFDVPKEPGPGEIRLGYIYRDGGRLSALIGDREVYHVVGDCKKTGLVTIRVKDTRKKLVECVESELYAGPRLVFIDRFKSLLESYRASSDIVIATDKTGEIVKKEEVEKLVGKKVAILFGGPKYDLFEISSQEGVDLSQYVDYVWNTIPKQRVVSVRTEEALVITLGVINAFLKGV
jgi:predicted SPOUT superfamily RNA methylase MTH1